MSLTIFEEFVPVLTSLSDAEIEDPQIVQRLRMASERVGARHVEMIYAPFDHINTSARVVIVGMTPGRFQAANALRAARKALLEGCQSACKRDPLSARKRDPLSRWRKVDRTRAFALRAA